MCIRDRLWRAHVALKTKLMDYLRMRARHAWVAGQCDPTEVLVGGTLLDPNALTIGFARRFATYKRATLLFEDMPRLQRLLLNMHRPVQIIFAGKAHPADEPGKHLIQMCIRDRGDGEDAGRADRLADAVAVIVQQAGFVQQSVGRRRVVGPLWQVGGQQGVVGRHEGVHDR